MRRFISPFLALLCLAPSLHAQHAFSPPTEPAQKIHGALVLAGGGSLPESVYDTFLKLAGGSDARLVIIPTAGGANTAPDTDKYLDFWKKRGPASVTLLHTLRA